jgi:prolyl oligopeptidase
MDLTATAAGFTPIWTTFDDQMDVLDNVGEQLLVLTNRHAPNQRVVRIDPAAPDEANWVTVIAERSEPVSGMSMGGGRLFATYLKDVTTRAYVHALDGTLEREIVLPGIGTAGGFEGEHDATAVYYSFTSFTAPITVYRYDIASGVSTPLRTVTLPFDPTRFDTTQVFVTSKDGTKVPAFIVAKKGLVLDGANPTMLYAYGGFNVSLPPNFSAMRVAFLEQGGVYVQANLRGGNEYGEAWHRAGMKEQKQNVFDDFVAVAEWLFEHRYTCSAKLAIAGGSNGGLLVGAIMTQRPTLAKVALPAVGVMDMLRFHKFTIGWNWIADYGSSDDAEGFRYLSAYSPLHNLKDGTAYPATLIMTADHDDRVVPAHSFKFAARLQEALARVSRAVAPKEEILRELQPAPRSCLSAVERGKVHLIPIAEVLYLRAELKYVTVRTAQREHLIEESLTRLEQEFAAQFVRVHRNCLVARAAIRGFERIGGESGDGPWQVLLAGLEERIPVSRRQQHIVRDLAR